MHQIAISCREAATAAILLIPSFALLNKYYFKDRYRSQLYLVFSIYLATMYAAVGLPDITYYRYFPHFNFKLFLYMFSAWESTLLNVMLFLPLGFFLPLLWQYFRSPLRTIGLGFLISLLIEFLQIFTYRATDVNDLITNTFGTIVGFLFGRLSLRIFPVIRPGDHQKHAAVVFSVSFGVMFFLYPFLCKFLL